MSAELPPDVRDRAARAAYEHTTRISPYPGWGDLPEEWRQIQRGEVDAVAAVVLGEDVIVLSKADAAWLCGVIHGEAETDQEYNRAHQLLEGGG